MSLEGELRSLMNQSLTRRGNSGYNSRGDIQYSTGTTTYACRQEARRHMVKDGGGRDVVAHHEVFVGTTSTGGVPAITVQDKVTLPDNTSPLLIAVETVRDESGTHHQVLHY
jgi:hypothetical protein